jgi:hypothetical protein
VEKPEITASDAKYIQDWEKLWKEWDKAVSKIGDENGPYVYYESHWDPPCFYGEPLSEALEVIAEQIFPLIEKIYKLKIEDEDKFFIALQEIEDRFHSYPEWIYADDAECTMSLNTTQCILDWQWLFAKEHEKPVRAFLNKLINIEEMLENIYLSTGTIIDFVISLSDEQQKEAYDYITENGTKEFFKEKLYKTFTAWHHIYLSLSRKFNRKVYLEMCKNMIDREWSYGCPLVDYYLEEKNYEEAEPILEKIFNSFAGNTQWNPEEMLLIKLMRYRDKDCKNTITDLLSNQNPWQRNTRLSVVARNALRSIIGEDNAAKIEKQVDTCKLSLSELDNIAEKGENITKGVLTAIFGQDNPQDIAFMFISDDSLDKSIRDKKAIDELTLLLEGTYGIELSGEKDLSLIRDGFIRFILSTDFLLSLKGDIPGSLSKVKIAKSEKHNTASLSLVKSWRLRRDLRDVYIKWADKSEKEFSLDIDFAIEQIARCETFLSIEKNLQKSVEEKLLEGVTEELLHIIKQRLCSFWSEEFPEIGARWKLINITAELILKADMIDKELKEVKNQVSEIVESYSGRENPWCKLDTLHRHMEKLYHNIDFDSTLLNPEKLIIKARQSYMHTGGKMAEYFIKSLCNNKFELPKVLKQKEIYKTRITPALKEGKCAYFIVDALRFEMAYELMDIMSDDFNITLEPALATVPTITEIGMASLMPDGERSVLVHDKGKLALKIDEALLKDRQGRIKYLKDKAGVKVCDIKLDDLLPSPKKKIKQALSEAQLIFITSQEIDSLWESDHIGLARRVIDEIFMQIRNVFMHLLELDVKSIILTSDHGHIFGEELDIDMKIDPPGGETIDLHRRAWAGHGGATSQSFLRCTALEVGLGSYMELAFPYGFGGFKVQGGGRAYFHGGISPQEAIIPVVKLTPKYQKRESFKSDINWSLIQGSKKISTRFFSVTIQGEITNLFEVHIPRVRVAILCNGETISIPVSASYGFTEGTGDVQLKVKESDAKSIEPDTVTLIINEKPKGKTVSVILQDAMSGCELAKLDNLEIVISI